MSNRCQDCNKFVGLENGEPELSDVEITNGGDVEGQVRLVLVCVECGNEIKELYLDFGVPVDHECKKEEPDLEIVDESAEIVDRYETKDRHGKPIKNFRCQKHYYGADITISMRCNACGEEFDVVDTVEDQASSFDEA